MPQTYETYDDITLDLLNGVKRGDLVKCNNWKYPLKVVAASQNYFLMSRKAFGKPFYSICEKLPSSYSRSGYNKGYFRIGTDNYVFGSPCGYEWETEQQALDYLNDLEDESPKAGLSSRKSVELFRICIKRAP